MPTVEMEALTQASVSVESRKIKIGKKGSKAPQRLKGIAITHALKQAGGSNFERDNETMKAIWNYYGIDSYDEHKDVPDLPKIPVRLLSDDVLENVHVYRGWYAASGPRCLSVLGQESARRFVDRKNGNIVQLDEPISVPCNRECSLWKENGEKSECGWKAILSCQIEVVRTLPNLAKFRPNGWNTIQYLLGSLNNIKSLTNGILAGIPFDLVWREVEARTKQEGKKRKYPVLVFEYPGTPQELREAAIVEMESRRRLKAAIAGKPVESISGKIDIEKTVSPQRMPAPVGGDTVDSSDDEDDDLLLIDDDDEGGAEEKQSDPPTEEESAAVNSMLSEMNELAERLGMGGKALEMLQDKHQGDIPSVIGELRTLQRQEPDGDDDAGLFDDEDEEPGEEEAGGDDGGEFGPGEMADTQIDSDTPEDDDGDDDLLLDDESGDEQEQEQDESPAPAGDIFNEGDDDDDFIFGDD